MRPASERPRPSRCLPPPPPVRVRLLASSTRSSSRATRPRARGPRTGPTALPSATASQPSSTPRRRCWPSSKPGAVPCGLQKSRAASRPVTSATTAERSASSIAAPPSEQHPPSPILMSGVLLLLLLIAVVVCAGWWNFFRANALRPRDLAAGLDGWPADRALRLSDQDGAAPGAEQLLPRARRACTRSPSRKQGPARSAGGWPTRNPHLDPLGRRQPRRPSLGPIKGASQALGPAAKPGGMP